MTKFSGRLCRRRYISMASLICKVCKNSAKHLSLRKENRKLTKKTQAKSIAHTVGQVPLGGFRGLAR